MKNDLISLFSQSVKHYPDKIAVQFFSDTLTYQQLDQLSDQIAVQLFNQKISTRSPIIIEVEKSLVTVVYLLGILKAGCYYIPVDSKIPTQRLDYLLQNSQCQMAFLYHHYDRLTVVDNLTCFLIEKDLSKLQVTANYETVNQYPALEISATDPVCCLYTSGSTGHPKGVLMSHAGMAAFFQIIQPCMNMSHNAICLNTAPFIFDVSIIDTFFPLTMGATVHISPEVILPNFILKTIHQYKITHMCGVSSTINLLFGNTDLLSQYNISSLVTVMTGAELLHQKTLLTLLKHSPSTTIINGYGLTETTCVCIAFTINTENVNDYLLYPIGKPLPGVEAQVLIPENSEDNRGELLLSSDLIMLEYLNNPEANNAAFVEYAGNRYFKTGDIVSYDQEQNFIFHGRNDTQIKIHGYRIDLNEIKYTLLAMEMIKEAEVFTHESTIVAALSLNLDIKQLNEKQFIRDIETDLSHLLPKYMHPKKWNILKDLPKLPTGKSDLKTLRMELNDTLKQNTELMQEH